MTNSSKKGLIKVLGIDIAKHSFQLHGVDEGGHIVFKKKLTRRKLAAFVTNLPPCVIGMEACMRKTNFTAGVAPEPLER
uniref:Transposase n=1 Tax=Candidatus Kentrum sp. TUN TaxID=2126343 RepID=A0A450ZMX5_9GAMM|nr:MAG: Transposase [Candidatus Kentron sp. TUN]VFK54259.1 MAG: Transposase [Candidatus Kentron sp. TUN]VFK55126.1 MAG: Transposase [Candidatus Kentron sp. TUN]